MVVRNTSRLSVNKPTGQGCFHEFVRLKFAAGTSVSLTLDFEINGTNGSEPIELPRLALTFYDIDMGSGLTEVLKVGGYEEGVWTYPTGEVVEYPRLNPDVIAASACTAADRAFLGTPCGVFQSRAQDVSVPNPTTSELSELTAEQRDATVTHLFQRKKQVCVTVTQMGVYSRPFAACACAAPNASRAPLPLVHQVRIVIQAAANASAAVH